MVRPTMAGSYTEKNKVLNFFDCLIIAFYVLNEGKTKRTER